MTEEENELYDYEMLGRADTIDRKPIRYHYPEDMNVPADSHRIFAELESILDNHSLYNLSQEQVLYAMIYFGNERKLDVEFEQLTGMSRSEAAEAEDQQGE